jgi:hypothetical protein
MKTNPQRYSFTRYCPNARSELLKNSQAAAPHADVSAENKVEDVSEAMAFVI